jgi:hypothetical protein
VGFGNGFNNSKKPFIYLKEEGSGQLQKTNVLVVSSGTLGDEVTEQEKLPLIQVVERLLKNF